MNEVTCDRWLAWLLRAPGLTPLKDLLGELDPARTLVTGGAVRDFVLGRPPTEVRDLDLIYTGDHLELADRFRGRYTISSTPFGNTSVVLSDGLHVDLLPPATPRGVPLTVREALAHADASGNALGLPLDGGALTDPTDGLTDLRRGCTRLLADGWNAPVNVLVTLLGRVIEQHARLGLRVLDQEVADRAYATATASESIHLDARAARTLEAYRTWSGARRDV